MNAADKAMIKNLCNDWAVFERIRFRERLGYPKHMIARELAKVGFVVFNWDDAEEIHKVMVEFKKINKFAYLCTLAKHRHRHDNKYMARKIKVSESTVSRAVNLAYDYIFVKYYYNRNIAQNIRHCLKYA